MTEHTFDSCDSPGPGVEFPTLVDDLRCRPTEWLEARREWLVREQRRVHVEELAVTRVLDERGRIDDSLAARDGVSVRSVRDTATTARHLENLPQIADAAARGELSEEQLRHVSRLADPTDPSSDARWAREAPRWSPADLASELRRQRTPTMADAAARRAARELRFWWRRDSGMLDGRFSLPDVDGALVEAVINRMIERNRPAKGEPWEPRERRAADALVELCRNHREAPPDPMPLMIVEVPVRGPATIAGIPLPDAMVEALRAQARIEPVLVTDDGEPIAVGRIEPALSDKTRRVIRQRDGKCRYPGCDVRVGLQIHHLWPRSWGGTDDFGNLAAVCRRHHALLVPQGEQLLLGNPNHPAGLTLLHRDDLPALAQLAAEHAEGTAGGERAATDTIRSRDPDPPPREHPEPDARAGPTAA